MGIKEDPNMTVLRCNKCLILLAVIGLGGYFDGVYTDYPKATAPFEWVRMLNVCCSTDIAIFPSGEICVVGYFNEDEIGLNMRSGLGTFKNSGLNDGYLLCVGQDGLIDSAVSLGSSGDDKVLAVDVDDIGNIYVSGYYSAKMDFAPGPEKKIREPRGKRDAFVLKLDSKLACEWVATFGDNNGDAQGYDILLDHSGEVVVVGSFEGSMDFDPGSGKDVRITPPEKDGKISYSDGFVIKLKGDGSYDWGVAISSVGLDSALQIGITSSNDIVVAGDFICDIGDSLSIFGRTVAGKYEVSTSGEDDIFIAMLDPFGAPYWLKSFGSKTDDCVFGLAVDSMKGIFYTGFTGDNDATFVSHVDFSGNLQWIRRWGESHTANASACAMTDDGFVYVLGSFSGALNLNPSAAEEGLSSPERWKGIGLFISKYDGDGEFRGAWIWNGDITGRGMNIIVADMDSIYVTGQSPCTASSSPHLKPNRNIARVGWNTFLANFVRS